MPEITIPYGNRAMAFKIADQHFQEILLPNQVEFPVDQMGEIKKALIDPVGTAHLRNLVNKNQKIALLCDDISRPTPTALILQQVVEELSEVGIRDDQLFIIMALGSHRPMTECEIDYKVGTNLRSRVAVYNSEFLDKNRMVDLGVAPDGVHIWADRRAMEADFRIGLGSIVPHPAVGWSGGGKIIYPGITGEDTVAAFHLQHGKVTWNMFGSEKSPVRESMEQWVDQVGLHFIVNVVCTAEGRIYKAVAGDYRQAHRVGVKYAKQLFGVKAKGKVEIAIVSSYPADSDFWQATKGVLAGDFLVKDDGTLILVTPCPEGVGPHPSFTSCIGNPNIENMLSNNTALQEANNDPLAMPVAATVARIKKRLNLALVSEGISHQEAVKAGFAKFDTLEEALNNVITRYSNPKIAVLPYGAETVPIIE